MRNTLLRTTSIAMLGFGLAAAPLAFAQDATQPSTPPAATAPAPSTGTAPAPNETVPEKMAPTGTDMNSGSDMSTPMDSTDASDPATTNTMDSAADTTAPAMETERVTIVGGAQPAGTVLATDLQGEPVENSAGEDLATLDDFVVDEDGRIVGAVISFGGFLGMGAKQVLLPWEELTIDGDDARVVLGMSAEQIEALPEFEPVEREDATAVNAPATTTAPAPAAPAPATPAQ